MYRAWNAVAFDAPLAGAYHSPGMRLVTIALSVALAAAAACRGSGRPTTVVDDSTFVATMVELHAVDTGPPRDSSARAAARRAVLARRGLSAERLERAARLLADDPERASAVWSAINRRLTEMKKKPQRTRQPPASKPPRKPPPKPPPQTKRRGNS